MQSFFDYQKTHEAFFKERGSKLIYKKGQYVVTPNEASPWVFFLVDGLVDASFSFSDGSKRIIGYFLPGMSFAQSGAFFSDSGGGLEYMVLEQATIYRVPQKLFLEQLAKDIAFNAEYTNWLLKTQILLIERIVYQGENTIQNKLLRWLIFMAKYYGQPQKAGAVIEVPLTQDVIADFLHVTRESIGKEMRCLVSERLISTKAKTITIFDLDAITMRIG